LNGLKNQNPTLLYEKLTSLANTHTQTENERIESDIPSKWNLKVLYRTKQTSSPN
jgi:hypothetical protein